MRLHIFVVALLHGHSRGVDELRVGKHDRITFDADQVTIGHARVAIIEREKLRQKVERQEHNVAAHDGRTAVLAVVLVGDGAGGEVERQCAALPVDDGGTLVAAAGVEKAQVRAGDDRGGDIQPPTRPERHRLIAQIGQKLVVDGGEIDSRLGPRFAGGEGEDHQQYEQQTQKTLALHFSRLLAYFILIL